VPKFIGKRTGKQQENRQKRKRQIIYGVILVVGVFIAAVALRMIIGDLLEDAAARSEYNELRAYSPDIPDSNLITDDIPTRHEETGAIENTGSEEEPDTNDENGDEKDEPEDEGVNLYRLSFDELVSLNRDFIGWIIAGHSIDYPVVRGNDNDKYINTTFTGNRNTAGAIFMDYRHTDGFDEPVSVIYGHNTRDRTMFSSLASYLDPDYMRNHPHIYITTREGKTLVYRVFAAKLTDAWDPAYTASIIDQENVSETFFNVPENATRFLVLSTCTRGPDDDERILVFTALI